MAPFGYLKHLSGVDAFPVLAPSNLQIGIVVKGVTRHSHDVQILAILFKPFLCHFGSVADNACGLESEVLLAEFDDFSKKFGFQEGLSP